MSNTAKMIRDFQATNPTEQQIELFYTNAVLPIDKRSIDEILADDPKITVVGYLGNDKEVTHDEYVEVWTDQVADLWKICDTVEEAQIADQIKAQVSDLASKDFHRLLEKQTARKERDALLEELTAIQNQPENQNRDIMTIAGMMDLEQLKAHINNNRSA